MSKFQRYWDDARAKVEAEGACRNCGRADGKLEAAHIMGRAHDLIYVCEPCEGTGHAIFAEGQRADDGGIICDKCKGHGQYLYVDPRDIVPLCGPNADQRSCHYRYDHGGVDLLPALWYEEQVRAVELAGTSGTRTGIVAAMRRLTNSSADVTSYAGQAPERVEEDVPPW